MICVDPGLRGCGVACFDDGTGELSWAGYVKNPNKKDRGPRAHYEMASAVANMLHRSDFDAQLVVEFPVIYPGVSEIDPNDLVDLAGVDGALAAHMIRPETVRHVTPREWKGQVPKKIMNRRVLSKLSDIEKSRIEKVGAKDHNTLDAIGIGLHMLGRLK